MATHVALAIRHRSLDHEGSCSGDECTPEESYKYKIVDIPDGLTLNHGEKMNEDDIREYFPEYFSCGTIDRRGQSHYCKCDDSYEDLWELSIHEYINEVTSAIGIKF